MAWFGNSQKHFRNRKSPDDAMIRFPDGPITRSASHSQLKLRFLFLKFSSSVFWL
jgi:hypothetical protein